MSLLLQAFAQFGKERRIELSAPGAAESFADHVRQVIDVAIGNEARLQGHRAQNMFEALLVSLGACRLVKVEDAGRFHAPDAVKVPDFRVVLADGRQWLIEVKNVYAANPWRQSTKFRPDYLAALRTYAALTGGELRLAIHWARWGIWTAIDPGTLETARSVDMERTVRASEMGALGDVTIGTRAPLRLRCFADETKPRRLADDGQAIVTIKRAEVHCADTVIEDEIDKTIAWVFMRFGEWKMAGPLPLMDGNEVAAIDYIWTPRETLNQGFEMIGTASRMFARYFAEQTISESRVTQIDAASVPEWFRPLVKDRPRKEGQLPLWRFILSPSGSAGQGKASRV